MRPSQASLHCTRNHISFFRTSWKDGLSKKIALEYDLPCIIGKDIFLFPESMILYLRRKMKDDLSQKNTRKYDVFFKLSEKIVFPKRVAPADDLSCIIRKDRIFFPKTWYIFLGQRVGAAFPRKYMEICVYVRVLETWRHTALSKKTKYDLIPQKYT